VKHKVQLIFLGRLEAEFPQQHESIQDNTDSGCNTP